MAFWKVSFLMLHLIGLELAQDIPFIPDSPADAEDIRAVSCPELYEPFNDNCYRVFKDTLSWKDADIECQKQRYDGRVGDLVSILSEEENNNVAKLWLKTSPPSFGRESTPWIGLIDTDGEGNSGFLWSDGNGVSGYSNWAKRQPKTKCNRYCAFFSRKCDWRTKPCDRKLPFICKFPGK